MFAALAARSDPDSLNNKNIRFIGGTENFDLWEYIGKDDKRYIGKHSAAPHPIYPLRVYRIAEGPKNWDVFKLPLHLNNEVNTHLPPLDRRISGYWNDVLLSRDDADIIEAYLRCFAPWVLGEALTKEEGA